MDDLRGWLHNMPNQTLERTLWRYACSADINKFNHSIFFYCLIVFSFHWNHWSLLMSRLQITIAVTRECVNVFPSQMTQQYTRSTFPRVAEALCCDNNTLQSLLSIAVLVLWCALLIRKVILAITTCISFFLGNLVFNY